MPLEQLKHLELLNAKHPKGNILFLPRLSACGLVFAIEIDIKVEPRIDEHLQKMSHALN